MTDGAKSPTTMGVEVELLTTVDLGSVHWLENTGTVAAIEISVDIIST